MGERFANSAAAIGAKAGDYAKLAGAFELVGGDAETAARTIELLDRNITEALANPNSAKGDAFTNLKIGAQETRSGPQRPDRVYRYVGRSLSGLRRQQPRPRQGACRLHRSGRPPRPGRHGQGGSRKGGGGVEELKQRWAELTGITDEVIGHLEQTAKEINELKAAFTGFGAKIYEELRDPINESLAALTSFIHELKSLGDLDTKTGGVGSAARDSFGEMEKEGDAVARTWERIKADPLGAW